MLSNTLLSPAGTNAGAKVILFPEPASTSTGNFFKKSMIIVTIDTIVTIVMIVIKTWN